MSIEPYQVTTIQRRPVTASDKPRTVADYQADLIRRFGRLPSHEEMARMERGDSIAQRPYVAQPAEPTPRLIAQKAAQAAKATATRQSILDALVKPMTAADIAHAIKRDMHLVRRYLTLLSAEGAVTGTKVKQVTVWTRKQEQGHQHPDCRAGSGKA